ncbi:hypothetical protein MKZ38_009721 [Zalerion maritima]|uniref:Heterokaryon incompatibility domain-containing protein n=1 Tax=Zalerion maritima TaxID=339359 RepID=A0AAD5S1B2_9PEZI|nr:hypothetical protein MKZ38_009721 [Zalerion maritima]
MGQYQYAPLQTNQIRVLHLLAGAGDGTPRGSLRVVDFETNSTVGDPHTSNGPPFDALSYVWGSDLKPRLFETPSAPIPITESLFSSLIRLRRTDSDRLIWADAICINQNDTSEKEVQVALMGEIYGRASRVLCDLGEESYDSEKALGLLDSYWIKNIRKGWIFSSHHEPLSAEETVTLLGLDLPSQEEADKIDFRVVAGSSEVACVQRFLSRPWFRRLWVVQEFVLGKEVIFLCGQQKIDWLRLLAGIMVYGEGWPFLDHNDPRQSLADLYAPYFAMCLTRLNKHLDPDSAAGRVYDKVMSAQHGSWGPGTVYSLHSIFGIFSQCKTRFPRDRFFGVLSFFQGDLSPELAPDYSSSDEEIILRFGRHCLTNSGGEGESLMLAGIPRRVKKRSRKTPKHRRGWLPSWLPDYTDEERLKESYLGPLSNLLYQAAGDTQFTIELDSQCDDYAHLVGCRFDVVTNMEKYREVTEITAETVLRKFEKALNFFLFDADEPMEGKEGYPTGEHIMDATWKTMCNYHPGIGREVERSLALGFRFVHRLILTGRRQLPQSSAAISKLAEISKGMTDFSCELIRSWSGKLVKTKKGYFGSVPVTTRKGDQIWIISGCRIPLVLRPNSRTGPSGMYRIVGTAYVHGIMNGEYLTDPDFKLGGVSLY